MFFQDGILYTCMGFGADESAGDAGRGTVQSLGTRIDSSARAATRAKTHLAPASIQGLEVLALPVTMPPDYVTAAAESNPILDINYDDGLFRFEPLPREDDFSTSIVPKRISADCADSSYAGDVQHSGFDGLERLPYSPFGTTASGEMSFECDFNRLSDDIQESETLQAFLHLQAYCMCSSEQDMNLCAEIIDGISDDGYFSGDLGVIAYECGESIERAESMLDRIQHMQPAGVGARDLRECLLLQIDPHDPHYEILATMISERLEDIAANRATRLAKEFRLSPQEFNHVRQAILSLNPRPGSAFASRHSAGYVMPDLVIRREGPSFTVEVAGDHQSCLSINPDYVAMAHDDSLMREARDYLQAKQVEATALLRNLDQRKATLYRFGLFLVERQHRFFASSDGRLEPLTMRQAADSLGVHVSTISRTVQGKYIQTPRGTYPLKMFFTRALPAHEAEKPTTSSYDIKQLIADYISKEDSAHPLSDAKITEILNSRGIDIKRRTVAKYRESLGVGTQSQRRR